jgi:hypothetical protein
LFIAHANVFDLCLLSSECYFDDGNSDNTEDIFNTLEIIECRESMKHSAFLLTCFFNASAMICAPIASPLSADGAGVCNISALDDAIF